jgi:crotonobetainyl-CoA:carnitine CoA-transferase CaiB-like acyl-CoA transferase
MYGTQIASKEDRLVLQDITVLDLTQLLPGPYCTQILADFGANVIKIESPAGDLTRVLGSKLQQESGPFVMLNRNKRSVVLNLKKHEGRDIFLRLAKQADVVVEGFRPGVLDNLGIGYEQATKINEKIIYCSISGYGQTGPYRNRPGHDINYISIAGILGNTGLDGSKPVIPGGQIADITGAFLGVVGIMLALWAREKTMRGQYIDVSMMDGAIAWLPIVLGEYMANKTGPKRGQDLLNGGYACYNVYETSDNEYMSLGALEAHFWETFCRETGQESLIAEQFADKQTQKEMIAKIQAVFSQKTGKEWTVFFQDKNVPCEPVLELEGVLSHPHVLSRDMVVDVDHPVEGKIKQIGIPIKLSMTPGEIRTPAPLLGEHTKEILQEIGITAEEIGRLADEKIVQCK